MVKVLIVVAPVASQAECIVASVPARQALERADEVFSGKVTTVETPDAPGLTQKLTLSVDESWKGAPIREQIVYHQISVESRVFQGGERLIVFAKQLDAAGRERVGLPRDGAPAFEYVSYECGGNLLLIDVERELRRIPSVKFR